jgi:hypothetical protein
LDAGLEFVSGRNCLCCCRPPRKAAIRLHTLAPSRLGGRPDARGQYHHVLVSHTKRTANLTRDVEEPADKSLPVAHGNDVATQPSVKAETAAGALESEQEH